MRCEAKVSRAVRSVSKYPKVAGPTPPVGQGAAKLPAPAQAAVDDLLVRLDRALPGRFEAFYVVGSACLGSFRLGRSDVDFVAIVAGARGDRVPGGLDRTELARLRAVHLGRWAAALARDVALHRRWPLVCNGSYLAPGSLAASPGEVTPLAGQVAGHFRAGARGGFEVNPVTWLTLAQHGIAVRGPTPDRLDIHIDPGELRAWTLENLRGYWGEWARRARRRTPGTAWALPRRHAAWGVLGVSRLHYTLATGEIASKVQAGQYAREALDREWRPLIDDALAFWRGGPPVAAYRRHPRRRIAAAAEFVTYVIEDRAGLEARSV